MAIKVGFVSLGCPKNQLDLEVMLGHLVKEGFMLIMGLISLKAVDKINGAKWFGKLSTVVIFLVVGINSLFDLSPLAHTISVVFAIGFMSVSLVKYALFYRKLIVEYKENKKSEE